MTRALVEAAAERDRQASGPVFHHRGGKLQGCVGNLFGEDVVIFHVENAGRTLHGVPPTERTTSCSCGQGDAIPVTGAYGSFCGDDTRWIRHTEIIAGRGRAARVSRHKFRRPRASCDLEDAAPANRAELLA